MKVVLLQDVPKVGRRNEIKNVSDGFAFNFLIPKKLAETATEKAEARIKLVMKREEETKKIRQDLLLKNFGDLKDVKVVVEKVANKEGHLFAAVHKDEILEAVKAQTRLEIDPEYLIIEEPVKSVGEHKIEVKVGDRAVSFIFEVKATEDAKSEVKEKTRKTKESRIKNKE